MSPEYQISFRVSGEKSLEQLKLDFSNIEWKLSDQFLGSPRIGKISHLTFEDLEHETKLIECELCYKPSIMQVNQIICNICKGK